MTINTESRDFATLRALPNSWFQPAMLTGIVCPELSCERLIKLGYLEVKTVKENGVLTQYCQKVNNAGMSRDPFRKYNSLEDATRLVRSAKERIEMVDGFDLFKLKDVANNLLDIELQKSVRDRAIKRLSEWPRDSKGDLLLD